MDQAAADRVKQIREYLSKMTPGPWELGAGGYTARVNDGNNSDWEWGKNLPLATCSWCTCSEHCTSTLVRTYEKDGHLYHVHIVTENNREERDWHLIGSAASGELITGNYDYEEGGVCSKKEDAIGIAALRTDAEWLLSQLSASEERVREQLEIIRDRAQGELDDAETLVQARAGLQAIASYVESLLPSPPQVIRG